MALRSAFFPLLLALATAGVAGPEAPAVAPPHVQGQIRARFVVLDRNRDGILEWSEVQGLMAPLHYTRADHNQDGRLNPDEFTRLCLHTDRRPGPMRAPYPPGPRPVPPASLPSWLPWLLLASGFVIWGWRMLPLSGSPVPAPLLEGKVRLGWTDPGREPVRAVPVTPPLMGPASPGHPLPARYALLNLIGEGACSDVFVAYDRQTRQDVAVKVLKLRAVDSLNTTRFEREIATLGRLSHPRIVRLLDGQAGARPFLVMERLSGQTLARALATNTFDTQAGMHVLLGVLEGLEYIHANGILHRDVKPANIILKDGVDPVLIDFSIALHLEANRLTEVGVAPGTLRYVAPEILTGASASPQSDLFATAVMGVETLYGLDVHMTDLDDNPSGAYQIESSLRSATYYDVASRALKAKGRIGQMLLAALSPEPELRPGSAAELRQELARVKA